MYVQLQNSHHYPHYLHGRVIKLHATWLHDQKNFLRQQTMLGAYFSNLYPEYILINHATEIFEIFDNINFSVTQGIILIETFMCQTSNKLQSA